MDSTPADFEIPDHSPVVITTTGGEVVGRPTVAVIGVVAVEGDTPQSAVAGIEDSAREYEADAVVDVRVIQSTAVGFEVRGRFFAYGTAVALRPITRPA